MLLVICKVELKLRWIKHCVLSISSTDSANGKVGSIIFTMKETNLYVSVVTLAVGDN